MAYQESIEEKQEYLRENILEKGFDANLFADYLIQKKGEEGADIGSWSMSDLIKVVKEFVDKQTSFLSGEENMIPPVLSPSNSNEINENLNEINNQQQQESIQDNSNNNQEQNKKNEQPVIPQKKINPEIYGIISPQTLPCKMVDNTPLSSVENPKIIVSSPEKKEGGFFSKSYIAYLVTIKQLNINVRRRYTDFVWLHQIIFDLYPYIIVPPIPKKNKIGGDRFNDVFICKRMRYLEKFLNWLVSIPHIKNSQLFYDFLSIEKEADFNKKKSTYQKMKPPSNLKDFLSPNGKMNLGVNNEKETYFQSFKDNSANNQELLNKLNISLKQLKLQMDIFIQKIGEVSQCWEDLFKNSSSHSDEIRITNTYQQMSKLFTNWAEMLKKQNNLIFIDLREYFKYVRNNFREIKSITHIVEDYRADYYKAERNLINKKEDLFKRADVSKWDLDPQEKTNANILLQDKSSALFKIGAKDTNNCIQRRLYYGNYLNRAIEEFDRMKNLNGFSHKETLMEYCRNLTDTLSEFHRKVAENLTLLFAEEKQQ